MDGESGGNEAMDFTPVTKIIFERIKQLEPELVTKIIGYILLKDSGDREMFRIAFARESVLMSLIEEAKAALVNSNPLQPIPRLFDSSPTTSFDYHNPVYGNHGFSEQSQTVGTRNSLDFGNSTEQNFINYYQEGSSIESSGNGRRTLSLPDLPPKPCYYHYTKGFCKHGDSCRYFHGPLIPEKFNLVGTFSLNNEGHVSLPPNNSLERLEVELIDLLRSRHEEEISIATLPILYMEKYGKQIQAERYLTENLRQGKPGSNLTKLLMRLSNSIRLIDRPHGKHSVVLAEEMQRYTEYYGNEKSNPGNEFSSSQQIYLTFHAESNFHEDDVNSYFRHYGPVRSVRIPPQQKRMFGFVSFEYPQTVKIVLGKGNPHYVCGHRVLVKPYREKARVNERRQNDNSDHLPFFCSPYSERKSGYNLYPNSTVYSNSSSRQRSFSDHFQTPGHDLVERLSHLQIAPRQLTMNSDPDFNHWWEDLIIPEEDDETSTGHQPETLNATARGDYNPRDEDQNSENDCYNTEVESNAFTVKRELERKEH